VTVAARRRLEAKAKSAGEKLTSLDDAAGRVKDGDHIVAGGCLFTRTPMALVREILRQRRTGLTLSRNLMCTEGELMMAAMPPASSPPDVDRPALGVSRSAPPRRNRQSCFENGAISPSACASAPPPWECPSSPR
jgi:hypothetical protein